MRSKKFEDLLTHTSAPSLSELVQASTIVLFNILLARSYPILEMCIRNAVNKGTRLFIINDHPTRLDDIADGVFRVNASHYRELLDLTGVSLMKMKDDVPDGVRDYFNSIISNIAFSSTALIKYEKILTFVRTLYSSPECIFITDENESEQNTLISFAQLTLIIKNKSKLLSLNKGTNPRGAYKYGTVHEKHSSITEKELKNYDTLFFYKLPQIFDLNGKSVIHLGFKPFSEYGSYAIFIPSSSLLETGGTTFLYNGKKTIIPSVINNKKVDNLKLLSKISKRIAYVSKINPPDSGPPA